MFALLFIITFTLFVLLCYYCSGQYSELMEEKERLIDHLELTYSKKLEWERTDFNLFVDDYYTPVTSMYKYMRDQDYLDSLYKQIEKDIKEL